jgi:hypothetical protein
VKQDHIILKTRNHFSDLGSRIGNIVHAKLANSSTMEAIKPLSFLSFPLLYKIILRGGYRRYKSLK